ncbi:Guanine nucleotide-binding protein subunit gamma [Dirofilaria immitis]|nr:Guanine nucleotide-binding protein subunit gamma [Dirofilaria immitis]
MSSRDVHSVQQARSVVEQLRRERNLRRTTISQTANDLVRNIILISAINLETIIIVEMRANHQDIVFIEVRYRLTTICGEIMRITVILKYTQECQRDDILLTGFPNDKMNPFRPKSSFQCLLL